MRDEVTNIIDGSDLEWWLVGEREEAESPILSEGLWRCALLSVGRRGREEEREAEVSVLPGISSCSAGDIPGR